MRTYRNVSSIARIAGFGLAVALAVGGSAAHAQIGLFGPVSPFGPVFRPLGPQNPTNIGNYNTPLFTVNPQGIRTGYLGPNGPYLAPGYQNAPGFPSAGAPVGSIGTGALYAPLSPTGTFGDPSQVEVYGASGQAQAAPPQMAPGVIPRTSDTIEARIDKDNRLIVSWSGDGRLVSQIRFALLDKDRNILKQELVKKLPAEARLAITSKTSYYQVYVEYVNGTTTNVISPL